MAEIQGFIGASNTFAAPVVDAEETINFFFGPVQPGVPKSPMWMEPTPGLRRFLANDVLPTMPLRGEFQQDGRSWAAGGSVLYEIMSDGTVTILGSIANDSNPVTFCSNGSAGNQLLLSSGGYGYVVNLSTNVLTLITATGFPYPCAMVAFMDGYGLALKDNTRQFNISALEDFLLWDPLDVAERSEGSDNLSALVRSHREIWLIGTQTTEVWYNNGDTFPFAPIQGVFIEQGCPQGAGYTVLRVDNTITFLTQNENGGGIVVRMDGYTPKRLSTTAIERKIQSQSESFDLSRAWSYQENGHLFYLLYMPGLEKTLVYDFLTDLWHERGHWNPSTVMYTPLVAICHMYAFGKHLVGDRNSGAIYEMTTSTGVESLIDTTLITRRVRTFPLPFDENRWVYLPYLEVVLQPGLGTTSGQGSDPVLDLSISRDGGKTFRPPRTQKAGPQGQYTKRARWQRNGRYRNGYGRISMTDPIPWYFVAAYDTPEGGTA